MFRCLIQPLTCFQICCPWEWTKWWCICWELGKRFCMWWNWREMCGSSCLITSLWSAPVTWKFNFVKAQKRFLSSIGGWSFFCWIHCILKSCVWTMTVTALLCQHCWFIPFPFIPFRTLHEASSVSTKSLSEMAFHTLHKHFWKSESCAVWKWR